MLYVQVPAPVKLVNLIDGARLMEPNGRKGDDKNAPTNVEIPEIDFLAFLMRYVVHETTVVAAKVPGEPATREYRIGKGYEGGLRVANLHDAFKGAKEGDVIGVEQADWTIVNDILKEAPLPPMVGAQLAPFMRAWQGSSGHDEAWKKKYEAEKAVNGIKETSQEPGMDLLPRSPV